MRALSIFALATATATTAAAGCGKNAPAPGWHVRGNFCAPPTAALPSCAA
jgi:hypothetical protein